MVDGPTLSTAMGHVLSAKAYADYAAGANEAMRRANITTVNRAAMWWAQLGHESVGLKYTEEISSGTQYNGRQDLGNTQPGDGPRFKGRSFIQITGRHNYTQLSAWAHAKGYVPSPTFFVDNPARLADHTYCWLGAIWYWVVARANLNTLSDNNDLEGATRAINGGLNGLADRRFRWGRCKSLGAALLPGPAQPGKDDDLNKEETEKLIAQAARALLHGEDNGPFTKQKYPGWVRGKQGGVDDRLNAHNERIKSQNERIVRLEKKVKP